jgi:hypothetical protein
MKFFFLDDSRYRNCSRPKVGSLVAVGGVIVDAAAARPLDTSINELCGRYGFPERAPFKWSPDGDLWMRDNLRGQKRQQFFTEVLELALNSGSRAQVTICDSTMKTANSHVDDHEMDVLLLSLERFDIELSREKDNGLVIVSRPSGNRKEEDKFLVECADKVAAGTNYSNFNQLAANVLTMPHTNSRLLQVADLVASITTAMVAGYTKHAGGVFPSVKPLLLRTSSGLIGGVGVKIHPDYSYINLYHWVLGDTKDDGSPALVPGRPFFKDDMIY